MNLKGKAIAITGAFGSLGSAVVRAALAEGARVAAIDRAAAPHHPDELAGALLVGDVDLGQADSAEAAFASIAQSFGGLDGLVNIAGGFHWETLADGSVETWDKMFNLNLRTAVSATKAALPYLRERGRGSIVNIGAMGANKAGAGMGAYAASKAGVAKLTEALAEELKDAGINVNAVLPSIIDTAPNRADMPKADFSRWVQPAQLAGIILFLLSDQASAITGAQIPVVGRV